MAESQRNFQKRGCAVKKKLFYILFVPSLTLILVFLVLPLVSTVIPTFSIGGKFSFGQYTKILRDDYFLGILVRTLKISLMAAIICAFLGVPVAYYISRSSKNIRGLLIVCSVFPLLTNSVVRAYAWMVILGRNGVLNGLLMALKLIDNPQQFLYTDFAILIGSIYLFLPLMIVSLAGVMENIEGDLMEAAESLGAGRLKAFFKVIFPLSVPGLIVGSVLVFTGTLTAYTTPQLLGGSKNMVLATLVFQRTMSLNDWNSASVLATIMIVTTVVVIVLINKLASQLSKRRA